MSYRIEYDRKIGKYEVHQNHTSPKTFVLLLVGAVGLAVWLGSDVIALRDMLIPGEDELTIQAFQNMSNDLRSGAGLGDAVFSFCRYIIHGT